MLYAPVIDYVGHDVCHVSACSFVCLFVFLSSCHVFSEIAVSDLVFCGFFAGWLVCQLACLLTCFLDLICCFVWLCLCVMVGLGLCV